MADTKAFRQMGPEESINISISFERTYSQAHEMHA